MKNLRRVKLQFCNNRKSLLADGLDLPDNLQATGFRNADSRSGLQDQVQAWIAMVKERRSMLSVGAGRRLGDVVGRGQRPFPRIKNEREILGMVVPVHCHQVHHHSAEHLLYLNGILCKIAREGQ